MAKVSVRARPCAADQVAVLSVQHRSFMVVTPGNGWLSREGGEGGSGQPGWRWRREAADVSSYDADCLNPALGNTLERCPLSDLALRSGQ